MFCLLGLRLAGFGFRLASDPATGAQDDKQVRQDALTRENVMLRVSRSICGDWFDGFDRHCRGYVTLSAD